MDNWIREGPTPKIGQKWKEWEERVPIKKSPSVRTQATNILSKVLDEWHPAQVLIGTGDENDPEIINNLNLPRIWEN